MVTIKLEEETRYLIQILPSDSRSEVVLPIWAFPSE